MATISAVQVKQLRDKTGAGMMECKAALSEAGGDIEEAVTLLRKRGLARAAKRAGRATAQGLIGSYIHMGGRIGVLVEVKCESRSSGMQSSAVSPEAIEKEKSIYRAQMEGTSKPAHVLDKIIEGKLGSFYSQFVLLDQPSIRDPSLTVAELVAGTSAKTGENITVGRFTRYLVGEEND